MPRKRKQPDQTAFTLADLESEGVVAPQPEQVDLPAPALTTAAPILTNDPPSLSSGVDVTQHGLHGEAIPSDATQHGIHGVPDDVLQRLLAGISNGLKPEAFERARDNRIFAYYYVPGRPLMGQGDVELSREQAAELGIEAPRACHCVRVVF